MSLRTKILLSICVVMVAVLCLLALNLWADMAIRAQGEMHRQAEFLARLVSDWIREEPSLQEGPTDARGWGRLSSKIGRSALVTGWVVAGHSGSGLRVYCSSEPDAGQVLRMEGQDLSDVLVQRRVIVRGDRVYARIDTVPGMMLAARFDLESAGGTAMDLGNMMTGMLGVMALGTVLLLVVTYVLVNRFVLRPLGALVDASERVSRGDFSTPIREQGSYDEMARMIQAFNLMMQKVEAYHLDLSNEVRSVREKIRETEKSLFAAQRLSTAGTLAAGIAHEINNPLGGMINALNTLRGSEMEEAKRREYLDLIEEGLTRVREIVAKVLQFRPRSLAPAPVDLPEVTGRALAFLEHRIRDKNMEIRNELGGDLPAVRGDALELQQAFLNILLNSVDAVETGRGVVTIGARASEEEGVRVEISDNGCGMTEEEIQRCFDPFYTTKEVGQGTGLGLSVAHNIVRNHGGRMEIKSAKGEGTMVSMIFPALKIEQVGTKQGP